MIITIYKVSIPGDQMNQFAFEFVPESTPRGRFSVDQSGTQKEIQRSPVQVEVPDDAEFDESKNQLFYQDGSARKSKSAEDIWKYAKAKMPGFRFVEPA
jgi:hypothetical protein